MNCEGSPESIGCSKLVSACLVPVIGGQLLLCVAKALFSWQLFDVWNKSSQIRGTMFALIFWETAPT